MVTEGQIRVVITGSHRIYREGLRLILQRENSIQIVGEAANGIQTIDVITDLKPDVVLLDITMPKMDGIEVIPPIREKSPNTKPLMLIAAMDEARIFKALKLGAKGYISKDAGASDLIKAIEAVHQGELWVGRKLMVRLFNGQPVADSRDATAKEGLTPREQEVLHLLTKGCTNKEIAQSLFISEKTVKSHLSSIFRKLNVTRRLQAILYAIKRGLS
jgi:DNA-binding NarL/FixJ family response regulator